MTAKPVIPREQARKDVEEAVNYYVREAGDQTALGFIGALESTFRTIADNPATGSPRYAHELDLPGLRSKILKQYPYLIFYVEREDHIDVWRVLHAHRDVPAWMQPPDGE